MAYQALSGFRAPACAARACKQFVRPFTTCRPPLCRSVAPSVPQNAGQAPTKSPVLCRASQPEVPATEPPARVGEDSAAFDLSAQSVRSWAYFMAVLTTVLGALYVVWIQPGFGLADDFIAALEGAAGGNSEATIALMLLVFAIAHSGLAGLRPYGTLPHRVRGGLGSCGPRVRVR